MDLDELFAELQKVVTSAMIAMGDTSNKVWKLSKRSKITVEDLRQIEEEIRASRRLILQVAKSVGYFRNELEQKMLELVGPDTDDEQ